MNIYKITAILLIDICNFFDINGLTKDKIDFE